MGFDIDKLGKAAEENKKKKAAGKFDISKVGAAAVQSKKTKSTKPVGKEVATAYYGRSAIEKLKKEPEKATVSRPVSSFMNLSLYSRTPRQPSTIASQFPHSSMCAMDAE